jgi:hypothetical protein
MLPSAIRRPRRHSYDPSDSQVDTLPCIRCSRQTGDNRDAISNQCGDSPSRSVISSETWILSVFTASVDEVASGFTHARGLSRLRPAVKTGRPPTGGSGVLRTCRPGRHFSRREAAHTNDDADCIRSRLHSRSRLVMQVDPVEVESGSANRGPYYCGCARRRHLFKSVFPEVRRAGAPFHQDGSTIRFGNIRP